MGSQPEVVIERSNEPMKPDMLRAPFVQPKNPFPFESSDEIDQILPAFIKAQASIGRAVRESKALATETRSYMYADLASCMDAVQDPLAANDIGVSFSVDKEPPAGKVRVWAVLLHKSSQWFATPVTMDMDKPGPQMVGKLYTYARRYGLCAITGLAPADDDDDGKSAQESYDRGREGNAREQLNQGRQQSQQKNPHEAGWKHLSDKCEICKEFGVKPGNEVVQRNAGDHVYTYAPGGPIIEHDVEHGSLDYCPICQENAKKQPPTTQPAAQAAKSAATTAPAQPQAAAKPAAEATTARKPFTVVERVEAITKGANTTQGQVIAFMCGVMSCSKLNEADRRYLVTTLDALDRFIATDGQKAAYELILDTADKDTKARFSAVWKEYLAKHPEAPVTPTAATPIDRPKPEPVAAAAEVVFDESDDDGPGDHTGPLAPPVDDGGIEGLRIVNTKITGFKSETTDNGPSILVQCAIVGPEDIKEKIAGFPLRVPVRKEDIAKGGWARFFLLKFSYAPELLDDANPKIKKSLIVGSEGKMLVRISRNDRGDGYLTLVEAFDRTGGTELEERLAKGTAPVN